MKKTRHIRVRLTENQFRWLAEVLIEQQRNKSSIIRDALNKYLVEYKDDYYNQTNEGNKNRR